MLPAIAHFAPAFGRTKVGTAAACGVFPGGGGGGSGSGGAVAASVATVAVVVVAVVLRRLNRCVGRLVVCCVARMLGLDGCCTAVAPRRVTWIRHVCVLLLLLLVVCCVEEDLSCNCSRMLNGLIKGKLLTWSKFAVVVLRCWLVMGVSLGASNVYQLLLLLGGIAAACVLFCFKF